MVSSDPQQAGPTRATDPAPVLLVAGTASSVGKSLLVTALCRIMQQDGIRVAPFKAQNMSNNAAVTADGLEIGRAQAEQAAAARVAPTVDMNPVLLKPQADHVSQIVLEGRPAGVLRSADFRERKEKLWPAVTKALDRLRAEYDLVIAEGAGAAIEPNLRSGDIVNMGLAAYADASVVIAGDIDRGGVFGHLLGTLDLMSQADRARVRGFIINRFRGDRSLLGNAIEELEERTGVPVLGVVPWIDDVELADEDAVAIERAEESGSSTAGQVDIAVIRLPRIANFDDFDPLVREPGAHVRYVDRVAELRDPSLVILPGTKATIADLTWLRSTGLAEAIQRRAGQGSHVLGICGGFQMLGETLHDEAGIEGPSQGAVEGLGLLPLATTFSPAKVTRRVSGTLVAGQGVWASASGAVVSGYEIHMGATQDMSNSANGVAAFLELNGRSDGAISGDGRIVGTYLHGLFHNDGVRESLLRGFGWQGAFAGNAWAARDAAFDRLASTVRQHLDMQRLRALLRPPN
jgi:adenosylcobyric acid synthase